MVKLKDILTEGVMDKGILKAVFLAGGPGSGKSFVASGLFGIPKKVNTSAYGLKLVNQDKELERMLKKYGFGLDLDDMPEELFKQLTDPDYEDYSGLRGRAKELTKDRQKMYMNGRLGMIIDGTGHNYQKIVKRKKELEEIGYDCYMVFVHTDLDIAQKRNMERPRKLNPEIVETGWNEDGSFGYTMTGLIEAEYQGRKVKLGKPMQGDSKKFKVYVKNDKGNVVKVNFGQGGDAKGGTMRIRKSNPKARKSFRARHNCDTPGPRHKARYWSCKKW